MSALKRIQRHVRRVGILRHNSNSKTQAEFGKICDKLNDHKIAYFQRIDWLFFSNKGHCHKSLTLFAYFEPL